MSILAKLGPHVQRTTPKIWNYSVKSQVCVCLIYIDENYIHQTMHCGIGEDGKSDLFSNSK